MFLKSKNNSNDDDDDDSHVDNNHVNICNDDIHEMNSKHNHVLRSDHILQYHDNDDDCIIYC